MSQGLCSVTIITTIIAVLLTIYVHEMQNMIYKENLIVLTAIEESFDGSRQNFKFWTSYCLVYHAKLHVFDHRVGGS